MIAPTPAPPALPPVVTTAAAARKLGVTGERVRQLVRDGRLPAAQVGGPSTQWLVALDDVEALAIERAAVRADRAARGLGQPGRPRRAEQGAAPCS